MEINELNKFKEILVNRKNNFEETLRKMKKHGMSNQDKYSPAELSNYDNHPAEIASELFQAEFNNSLITHQEHQLRETNDALERINQGVFGNCEVCGKEIEKERLEAVPHATTCLYCEKNRAGNETPMKANMDRPNEELVMDAPLGRKYLNSQEDDEHEGMDQFFDLVKYGSSDSPQDMGGYNDYEEYYTNRIDEQGIVDKMDQISNQYYKKQLPD
ncbi:MAG TPA: conjugal transfer protein TraR [Clostridiaceae bacterium]|nr:conjugal transfer protein TraR [Clostridiaceae bacterium]